MGILNLMAAARAAGLEFIVAGERLVIRGPKRAGPIAEQLLARKPEVLRVLADSPCCGVVPITRPTLGGSCLFCPTCGTNLQASRPYPWRLN